MEIPAQFAAEQALVRQNAALSMIRAGAQADRAIIGILEQSVQAIAASNRGNNVNISV